MDSSIENVGPNLQSPPVRAVAYFRCSVQKRQENSIAFQQNQVRRWAHERGIEIIKEFCDYGPSGRDYDEQPAFIEMLSDWIQQRTDFEYVLCLDASRLGRYAHIGRSAQFCEVIHQEKKRLIYTSIDKPRSE